ncbi:uncharacterized protein BDR25DRAFT_13115 [Lindgomyces ingoldianus]|uniref:Uncharacterized protein n=1 Tax=Lindgomyces ingoldianus TaxID=673940 RepID=A0ACB6R141_9PLEO|nr:uncharacterized protein BDR25DRAFT_13115 [Lindgomyces ingoldianus]KAF2472998.1 hypothetical protein BDR25DRAFT_13115 [Lindgomyces ingoldianus]
MCAFVTRFFHERRPCAAVRRPPLSARHRVVPDHLDRLEVERASRPEKEQGWSGSTWNDPYSWWQRVGGQRGLQDCRTARTAGCAREGSTGRMDKSSFNSCAALYWSGRRDSTNCTAHLAATMIPRQTTRTTRRRHDDVCSFTVTSGQSLSEGKKEVPRSPGLARLLVGRGCLEERNAYRPRYQRIGLIGRKADEISLNGTFTPGVTPSSRSGELQKPGLRSTTAAASALF